MRYAKIKPVDTANGEGVRVSLFVQGCNLRCPGCFNPETWDFRGGESFTDDTIEYILDLMSPDYITGLSILGGEPFDIKNIWDVNRLCHAVNERYGKHKTIWIYTGYKYAQLFILPIRIDTLLMCDVLVDGPFIASEQDLKLKFRGSRNQRIIDLRKSMPYPICHEWEPNHASCTSSREDVNNYVEKHSLSQ